MTSSLDTDWTLCDASTPVLRKPGLESAGVAAAITTRAGGVSEGPYWSLNMALHVGDDPARVVENRRRAARCLDAELEDVVVAEQVHGNRAVAVTAADRGRGAHDTHSAVAGADALVTTDPRVVLTVLVADCVPLVLVDPRAGVLACVHAGWRGTAARITDATLQVMVGLGASPARVQATMGPAIAASSYRVGPPVAEAVRRCFGDDDASLEPDGPSTWRFDLAHANRRLLTEAGVCSDQVEASGLSTNDGRLFSYRQARGRPCGRFALLARLHP